MTNPTLSARIRGGLWGLLVGDAVGVPYEFRLPEQLPALDQIDLDPPPGFDRAHAGVPPGTWSDDGAHALCLLASLLDRQGLDAEDLIRRLNDWYEVGYLAVGGRVFDVGIQTSKALAAYRNGTRAIDCGSTDSRGNGNGSLMRVLPLALWHQGTDAELVADAHQQSTVTHGHPRAQVCCALYCLWARRLLRQNDHPWEAAVATLRSLYADGSTFQAELEFHIRPDDEPLATGSGYVVDCLRSARVALREPSYEAVIRAAIALGRDTDTTACVAGGLAGIRDGVPAIPDRWLARLRAKELAEPLIEQLVKAVAEHSGV
jgi:ADP-ribosyl-[dinitrogen reductase] hydrolase